MKTEKEASIYTLMYKNDEVFTFSINFKNRHIKIVEKLAHYDKAPYGILNNKKDPQYALMKFFNGRSISASRADYEKILKATNTHDSLELSFKGHGLSLSNHYWYKKEGENLRYENINFFTNKWDDSFARAVLNQDYEALKHCSLNVPDLTITGWAVKGWLCEDVPTLYKIGIDYEHPEECIGEVLASRLASRLFKEGEYVKYRLEKINGKYASASPVMLGIDEELISLSNVLPYQLYTDYLSKTANEKFSKEFFEKVAVFPIPGIKDFFVKLACFRTLCFLSDIHFENISVIRNMNTGTLRPAPIYDLAGTFGGSRTGRNLLSNPNKATLLMVYFIYGTPDPEWDLSWYNPNSLDGFEKEIREYLSLSSFYDQILIDAIINVFEHQKASLDEAALKHKELANK